LFEWEARQILRLPHSEAINAVIPFIEEAYENPAVSARARQETGSDISWEPTETVSPVRWLEALLADESRLKTRVSPAYWSERNGEIAAPTSSPPGSLAKGFLQLLAELQDRGYFPRALPRECTDDGTDYDEVVRLIEKATKLKMTWPTSPVQLRPGEVYSLMEYFHDQAQRPRTYDNHKSYGCGAHYDNHNREAGGVVYRWRVNELLAEQAVDLRLASTGAERGRLVRHFGSYLDELADAEVATRADDVLDEVAQAIRDYRQRGATLPQKRAALALLAGALEPRRKTIGATLTKKDEGDLFQIANGFAIRHRNAHQQTDFDESFLDWIFWNYLSMIGLMEELESRASAASVSPIAKH